MTSYSLEEIAAYVKGQIVGNKDHLVTGIENLESATSSDISFLENPRYESSAMHSKAGIILIPPSFKVLADKNFIVVEQPSLAFQKVIELFIKETKSGFSGIHPTAIIHDEARLGHNLQIGPYVVIDRGAHIEDNCRIGAHTYIGPEVIMGSACEIHPRVTIHDRTRIGNRVVIQSGAVIGSSGFGYHTDTKTGMHTPLKQLGHVILEDDVEIGANTTIDRARFKTTRIGKGSKIDNLVQIAHQVDIGKNTLIVAQVGIAGSTKIGNNVVIAGQVGIVGHIAIADNVILAARSAVSKSIPKAGVYSGAPAIAIKDFNEQMVYLKNIKKLFRPVKEEV